MQVRKNIIISKATTAAEWTHQIDIDFVPDEMIIRGFSLQDNASTTTLFVLKSSLVDYNPILTFVRGDTTTGNQMTPQFNPTNIVFDIKKPVHGSYNFQLFDDAGDQAGGVDLIIGLHLEFVRYNIRNRISV